MIPFKIGTKEIELPTHHGEITLRQFILYRNEKNPSFESILSLFTGLTKDEIYSCSDFDLDSKVWPHLEWITKECDYTFPLPVNVKIGKKLYKIPSVYESTYGQKVVFRGIFDRALNDGVDLFNLYPEIITLYFFPLLKGKFTENYFKDEYINNLILDMRIDEALPAASFFLTNFQAFLKQNPMNLDTSQPKKNKVQVFHALKNSVLFRPFIHSRKTLINLLMKCCKWTITRSLQSSSMKQKVQSSNAG